MGVDFVAKLVVGVELSEMWVVKQEYKEVTRYNEKTGKAYQRKEAEISYWLCGKQIELPEKVIDDYPCEFSDWFKEHTGLEIFYKSSDHADEDGAIVGKEIAKTNPEYDGTVQVPSGPEIEDDSIEVLQKLKELGYRPVGIRLWLIPWVGC